MTVERLHVSKRFSEIAIAGNLVHLAGQLATDVELDIKGQTQQTLDIIDQFLADAGTDKSHIMSVTIYLKDIEKLIGKKILVINDHPFPLMEHNPVKAPKQQRNSFNRTNRNSSGSNSAGNNNKKKWFGKSRINSR